MFIESLLVLFLHTFFLSHNCIFFLSHNCTFFLSPNPARRLGTHQWPWFAQKETVA